MPRVKISEFRAKTILNDHLGSSYSGFSFDEEKDSIARITDSIEKGKSYVAKVDQGVKKRFKQGLLKLDLTSPDSVVDAIGELVKKGYRHFIVEEIVPHELTQEKYLALERTRLGTIIYYSHKGGVEIESHESEVKKELVKDIEDIKRIASELDLDPVILEKIVEAFDTNYFSFLEINPLVITFKKPYMLDVAAEVDSAAEFFVDTWSLDDVRSSKNETTDEEKNIKKLSEKSSSSLTLNVLNPDGAIFVLLSGGGVSVALADEVKNLGYGERLANYGEYSGNPSEEETYLYTKNLLSLLLKSKAPKKVLIIAGGVANFTDVRITFKGVIRALDEVADDLKNAGIKVFVRRGGPHQKEGLAAMEKFLKEKEILGAVHGPELVVSDIVGKAIETISN